jgi:hypothetical protein
VQFEALVQQVLMKVRRAFTENEVLLEREQHKSPKA